MTELIAMGFTLLAFVLGGWLAGRYLSKAAPPDDLFAGEHFVDGLIARLSINGSRGVSGTACLTDMRVCWVPTQIAFRRVWMRQPSSLDHPDAVLINLGEVRRLDLQSWVFNSRLDLVTPEGEYRLESSGSLERWMSYLAAECSNLLPHDEEVVRTPVQAMMSEKAIDVARSVSWPLGIFYAVLGIEIIAPVLDSSATAFVFALLTLPVAAVAYVMWDNRTS